MVKSVDLSAFLATPGCIFDVRSLGEFSQGHIPGAHILPLFSDDERAHIGTLYKQTGRKEAVIQGMRYAAPKFPLLIEQIELALSKCGEKGVAKIHCWRGGMRSGSLSMLLEMAGIESITLEGGYKRFRKWVLDKLQGSYQLHVIGGMTGSGKTGVLQALRNQGAQILDLEAVANHRGSTFGAIDSRPQPSNEQFENAIAYSLLALEPLKPLWVENESRLIGKCKVPDPLFLAMRRSPLFMIERSSEARLERIQRDYWQKSRAELIESVRKLSKKLGGVKMGEIVAAIEVGDLRTATIQVLDYYDRSYQHELERHPRKRYQLDAQNCTDEEVAGRLLASSADLLGA